MCNLKGGMPSSGQCKTLLLQNKQDYSSLPMNFYCNKMY